MRKFLSSILVLLFVSCGETPETPAYVKATNMELARQSVMMSVNNSQELIPVFYPENATSKDVVWSVVDDLPVGCVSVNQTGEVAANQAGTAVVCVQLKGTKVVSKCVMTVLDKAVELTGLLLPEKVNVVFKRDSVLPIVTIPTDATDYDLKWELKELNPAGCASINQYSGRIKALSEGTAVLTLTATTVSGEIVSAQTNLRVTPLVVTSIVIPSKVDIFFDLNPQADLDVESVLPTNAPNKGVLWSVKSAVPEGCVVIDENTGELVASAPGKAIVVATAQDVGQVESNECVVNVMGTSDAVKISAGKKGACYTLRDPNDPKGGTYEQNMPRVIALKPKWNYSWGVKLVPNQPTDLEFIPMIWSGGNSAQQIYDWINLHIQSGRVKRMLGFNEPDKEDQANMSVDKVIQNWPNLEAMNIPLGSPATAQHPVTSAWFKDFWTKAMEKKYRIDFVCVHDYGGGNAQAFKDKLTNIYKTYKRPLLITEFAVADWNAKTAAENKHSKTKVLNFMKSVLPWMEQQEWIIGYSWFSFGINSAPGTSSALFNTDGTLTELGQYYSDFDVN